MLTWPLGTWAFERHTASHSLFQFSMLRTDGLKYGWSQKNYSQSLSFWKSNTYPRTSSLMPSVHIQLRMHFELLARHSFAHLMAPRPFDLERPSRHMVSKPKRFVRKYFELPMARWPAALINLAKLRIENILYGAIRLGGVWSFL